MQPGGGAYNITQKIVFLDHHPPYETLYNIFITHLLMLYD